MENWRQVVGIEGYEVSDLGRVRSVDRIITINNQFRSKRSLKGKILSPTQNKGHFEIGLGRRFRRQVHRLVLEAFIGPCPEGHECLHRNGVGTDNVLGNLRWGTDSENMLDSYKHGDLKRGEENHLAKLSEVSVREILPLLKSKPVSYIAKLYGVHPRTIRDIRSGDTWAHVSRKC